MMSHRQQVAGLKRLAVATLIFGLAAGVAVGFVFGLVITQPPVWIDEVPGYGG